LTPLFARKLSPQELRNFWMLVHSNDGPRIYHHLVSYLAERDRYEQTWLAALACHTTRLALVWGQADPIATPAVADAIVRLRPDAAATRLAHIGHYPHWEAPEVTARAIDAAFSSA
jgi:pimeloyl-ACP methyl ester carboxylesterase